MLLMENVPNVHGKKNIEIFNAWIEKLESLGYSNFWKDLNSKDFGVPQNRKRCFMVSLLNGGSYNFPSDFQIEIGLKDVLEQDVDEKYYISQEQAKCIRASTYNQRRNLIVSVSSTRGLMRTLTAHECHETTCVELFDCNGKSQIRKLTPKETWRLMGFDDEDFEKASKVNSNTQLYKQAGNSIVVPVLEVIFKEVIND